MHGPVTKAGLISRSVQRPLGTTHRSETQASLGTVLLERLSRNSPTTVTS